MKAEGSTLRRVKDVLWILVCIGAVALVLRLTQGLGRTTALSDEVPWGSWKILNMLAGVALGTGGFAIAFAGHVLRLERIRPLVRPAILVALLGYASSCFALFLDIGRPFRIWHVLVHWNVHSFLFEVAWCVMLYLTVTVLEFAPIALEGSRHGRIRGLLKRASLPVVVAGITFSVLHHTSLGSLFLVAPHRLHPLWSSPWLPVHFILSAVGGGLMFVVLGTLAVARLYRHRPPLSALRAAAVAAAVILALFVVTRAVDLGTRGRLGLLLSGEWESVLFLAETVLGALVPVALVAVPAWRRSVPALATAAACAVAGLVLNRLDVGIFGFWRSGATSYVPSLAEIAITIGIPAAAGLALLAVVERFRVFETEPESVEPVDREIGCTQFEALTGVWSHVRIDAAERWSLMAVFVVPIALLLLSGPGAAQDAPPLRPPLAADASRTVLRLDADRNGDAVTFPHADHQARLGGDDSCRLCHHVNLPGDRATSCRECHRRMHEPVSIFDHELHQARLARREGHGRPNRTCELCHEAGRPRVRRTAAACASCHADDMGLANGVVRPDRAPAYADAMHGSCVGCHESRAEPAARPHLSECSLCHR